jgi:hypothetical protein
LGIFKGNSEGFREQAKAAKILADACLDFLQKATKTTKVFAAAEDKAFVSLVVFCFRIFADAATTFMRRLPEKHNLCSLRYLLFKSLRTISVVIASSPAGSAPGPEI